MEMAAQTSRIRDSMAEERSVVETVCPPVAHSELQSERKLPTALPNPRQRFDTLARLLDDRLKQAKGAAESRSGSEIGPNTVTDADTP
jgi:hypothetical protein